MASRRIELVISPEEDGLRTGEILRLRGFSARRTARLKRTENGLTVNGVSVGTGNILRSGDVLSVYMPEEGKAPRSSPRLLGLAPVRYEDDDVIVFAKPVNMPVHTSQGHRDDALENLFAAVCPGTAFRPIYRLDKDTSGLVPVAKNAHAARLLQNNINKVYFAAAEGTLRRDGVIDAPIGREDGSVIRRCVRPDGQHARTVYTIIKGNGLHTLVRVVPETGRTHQIRVHFAHMGHPLAGDDLYGGSRERIAFQALHCGEISFVSPVSGEKVVLSENIRDDMSKLFE